MEGRGAARLFFWTGLGLLLISGADVGTTSPNTFPMDSPVELNIPANCPLLDSYTVEWKKENTRLRRKKPGDPPQALDSACNCKILPNGTLYLQHLEREGQMKYLAEVHDKDGVKKCNTEVIVIGQYPVDTPFMNYTCNEKKKKVEVRCYISQGTDPELHLKYDGTVKTGKGKSLSQSFTIKQDANVTCTAKNEVRETSHTVTLSCEKEGWDWYLYLAAGAGGVAFIIFIVLIIYSVRSCRRPDEETVYNRRQIIQERHLPQPPGQASAPPPSLTTVDEMDYINSQKPSPHRQGVPETAPEGKKGRRTRPRPPEPLHVQSENLPLNHQGAAPQQTRPALPGNHPNDQVPRPTPRTKSKPPRQNRKSH
ncbi:T-cell surface antigen CD2-like [Lithobates pipiens]